MLLLWSALLVRRGGVEELEGIILPPDGMGMHVRNEQNQFEAEWTSETKMALMTNTPQVSKGLSANRPYPVKNPV
ncbi:MAG: hypothetical protein AAGA96_12625 [Verrucomicrobiota bacterium]